MDLSKRSNLGGAVLVIATSACPEAIGHAYPGCEVIVAGAADLADGFDALVSRLWERSVRLDAVLAQDGFPSWELASFLASDAAVLVASGLAQGSAWSAFLDSPWLQELGIAVRVVDPIEF